MRITQGTFSFLPDLDRRADRHAGPVLHRPGLGGEHRVHRRPASAQHLLGDVGPSDVRHHGRRPAVMMELNACRKSSATATSASPASTPATAGRRSALPSSSTGRRRSRASASRARKGPAASIRYTTRAYVDRPPPGQRYTARQARLSRRASTSSRRAGSLAFGSVDRMNMHASRCRPAPRPRGHGEHRPAPRAARSPASPPCSKSSTAS